MKYIKSKKLFESNDTILNQTDFYLIIKEEIHNDYHANTIYLNKTKINILNKNQDFIYFIDELKSTMTMGFYLSPHIFNNIFETYKEYETHDVDVSCDKNTQSIILLFNDIVDIILLSENDFNQKLMDINLKKYKI